MTPDGTRNLYVCEFIRLICEMLKSENTFKETALSKAVAREITTPHVLEVRNTLWYIL